MVYFRLQALDYEKLSLKLRAFLLVCVKFLSLCFKRIEDTIHLLREEVHLVFEVQVSVDLLLLFIFSLEELSVPILDIKIGLVKKSFDLP